MFSDSLHVFILLFVFTSVLPFIFILTFTRTYIYIYAYLQVFFEILNYELHLYFYAHVSSFIHVSDVCIATVLLVIVFMSGWVGVRLLNQTPKGLVGSMRIYYPWP